MDLSTANAIGTFLGIGFGMTIPGLLVALLYPALSTCRLRTAIWVGIFATVSVGIGLGWLAASGAAHSAMKTRLAAEGLELLELGKLDRAFADGWIDGFTRDRAWRIWTQHVPAMVPVSVLASVFGWSIRRAIRGR